MKAYHCKNKAKIKIKSEPIQPPGTVPVKVGDVVEFERWKGLYAVCKNNLDEPVYIGATTDIEFIK